MGITGDHFEDSLLALQGKVVHLYKVRGKIFYPQTQESDYYRTGEHGFYEARRADFVGSFLVTARGLRASTERHEPYSVGG